jgi:hypothetical protein
LKKRIFYFRLELFNMRNTFLLTFCDSLFSPNHNLHTMKNLIIFFGCFITLNLFAQQSSLKWSGKFEAQKAFIENKGQFNGRNRQPDSQILYAVDEGSVQVYFTKKGLTYRFDRKEKNKDRRDGDESKPKIFFDSDIVNMIWEGANPNAELVAEEMTPDYYTYAMRKNENNIYDIEHIKGFKKLVYKNLYNNIDVEYVFHPNDGIKYSFILHPGADISQVKMNYDTDEKLTFTELGELFIDTKFGDMVDHAPQTFYADKNNPITSRFTHHGNTVSFELGDYDHSKMVVIDPWTQTPVFANSNGVWEVDVDAIGNIYVIGGDMPMKLRKYDNTGATLWTYITPYDTADYWLGTMATDLTGNTYVTSGSLANIQKVNTSGGLTWNANGGSMDEYWTISFNCDQTKMVVGGTRLGSFPPADSYGVIYEISTIDGSIVGTPLIVGSNRPGAFINDISEVRSMTASKNARYYYLTLDTIGSINQNLTACQEGAILFEKNHTYAFGYKSEDYRPNNGNSGIKAIKAGANFVYTHNGTTIDKRSQTNGAILASASIPGGLNTSSTFGSYTFNQPGCNGLDIDANGNVYVGSGNGVYKYDSDLNLLSSSSTSFAVFDVAVSTNGDVIVCGATGSSSSPSRTGYVQSFDMSAGAPVTLECCDANICSAGPFCSADPAVTLTPATTSGTWSGPGITNSSTGLFDPSIAGVGLHTITNTIGCGSGSIEVKVTECVDLDICLEDNGTLTANNGTAPYTWEYTGQIQDCSNCVIDCNFPPGCATLTSGWVALDDTASTTSVAPDAYPVRVTDSNGNTIIINSSGSLTSCIPCAFTLSATPSPATCSNANGSIDLTVTGGTEPYNYVWSPGGATSQDIFGLTAGTYSVIVADNTGCHFQTSYTVVSESTFDISSVVENETCNGFQDGSIDLTVSGGVGPYTYLWSNSVTTQDLSGLSGGDYSVAVTDQGNQCSGVRSFTILDGYNFSVSITQDGDTLTATVSPNYQWFRNGVLIPGAINQSYTISDQGNYHVIVDIQNCEFSSNSILTNCICSTGIQENNLFEKFSVFPNPANEELNVVMRLTSAEFASITLLDLTGRRLWLKKETDKANAFSWKIPVTNLAAGNYFVQVTVGEQSKRVKVLVKN